MSSRRINSVSEIHADQLTFGSLQWLHGVFHPISYGAGRDKKHSCWRGVQTRLGEPEKKLWYQLVESLIQKAGEQALLDALIEWESNHNYTRASPQEVRKEALRLHTARLFDDPRWIHFVPFNRKYRPEALEAAHLVTVVSECCHKVVIENKDFEKLIRQYDRPVSFFYLDPPYHATEGYYQNIGEDGFTEADHIRLRDALMRIQGKFLLSYNDDAFIRGLYDQPSIYLMETTRINNIKQRYDNGAQFPELLIANYDLQERSRVVPSQMTLFDWTGGEAIG